MKKHVLPILILFLAISIIGCDEEIDTACRQGVMATVRDLTGLDGCGFVFELADGTRLEPHMMGFCGTPPLPKEVIENPLYNFEFIDGKKVKIAFEEIPDAVSICMVGKIVKITCIEEPFIPVCIKNKITELKNEEVRNPPASIWQYSYQGKTVYYIPQFCCDFPSVLLNPDCSVVCSPDGGITGNGDGKCADFFSSRKNEVLIWKDNRN